MSDTPILPLIAVGLSIIVIVTAPIWLSRLLGIDIRNYECGLQSTSNGFNLYCNSR